MATLTADDITVGTSYRVTRDHDAIGGNSWAHKAGDIVTARLLTVGAMLNDTTVCITSPDGRVGYVDLDALEFVDPATTRVVRYNGDIVTDRRTDRSGDSFTVDSRTGFLVDSVGKVYVGTPDGRTGWAPVSDLVVTTPNPATIPEDTTVNTDTDTPNPAAGIALVDAAIARLGGPGRDLDLTKVSGLVAILRAAATDSPVELPADTTPAGPAWDVHDFDVDVSGRRVRVVSASAPSSYVADPEYVGKEGVCSTDDRHSDGSVYVTFDGGGRAYVDHRDLVGITG